MVTTLAQTAIESNKVKQSDGQWSISVDSDRTVDALRYLNDQRLLKDGGEKPIEQASVLGSREDQRFHYERSLSQEIGRTLSEIPGVLDARVHLNLPLTDPLFGQPIDGKAGTASVLVVLREGAVTKDEIALLVSGASGIAAGHISVLITKVSENAPVIPGIAPAASSVSPLKASETANVTKPASSNALVRTVEMPSAVQIPTANSVISESKLSFLTSRNFLWQAAISLCIVGTWLMVRTLRSKKTAKVFAYEN